MPNYSYTPSDTGLTFSDDLVDLRHRRISDTGFTFSENKRVVKVASGGNTFIQDTLLESAAVTVTESIVRAITRGRAIADTGLTQTDAFVWRATRALSDTLTFTDVLVDLRNRSILQTGLAQTDSLAFVKIGTMDEWVIDAFRKWTFDTTRRVWFVNAIDTYYGRSGDAVTPQSRRD